MGKVKRGAHHKAGVFLTLGITFLSLIVLGLATLILRNAESSDERLRELSAFDRLYNLDRSVSDAFKVYDLDVAEFRIIANTSSIIIAKSTDKQSDQAMAKMVFAKTFFDTYLLTLYNDRIINTLPDFGWYGLTFERQKSGQDLWYRYFFAGNITNITEGFLNSTWVHVVSFNESFGASNPGAVASLEIVLKSNVTGSLNISVQRHATTCTAPPCGTVRFRLKILNKSDNPICVPPFPEDPPPAYPNKDCNTWKDVYLQAGLLHEIYYIDNMVPFGQIRPLLVLGWISGFLYSKGAYVAVGPANATLTTTINVNLTTPENVRVYDVARESLDLSALNSGRIFKSIGPIRIL